MQLTYLSEQAFATACLTWFMLGGSVWQQAACSQQAAGNIGEGFTMSCNHMPYDTKAPATCCSAGQEVLLAEAQQGARPEETAGGCSSVLYPSCTRC